MACVGLFSRLGIYCIPLHSCRCYGGALASSISVQQVCMFSQCRNGLLVGRCDACWWVLSRWFPKCRIGPGDAARHWCFSSHLWLIVPLWAFGLVCLLPGVPIALISCSQCWLYKDFWRLALFVSHSKNDRVEVKRRSHRWGLDAGAMTQKSWNFLSWHWSVNFADNEGFGHSQLETHLPHPNFSEELVTRHLQLHLPCLGGNRFENSIERALGPNGLVGSSNSLYP